VIDWRRLRWRSLSLRSRLTTMVAFAVAVAVVGVSVMAFLVVNAQLRHQLDEELWSDAQTVAQAPDEWDPRQHEQPGDPDHDHDHDVGPWVQLLDASGRPIKADARDLELPVSAADRAVASGAHAGDPGFRLYREIEIDGVDYRMVTVPVLDRDQAARAVQVALSTHEVKRTLGQIGLLLVLVSACGVAVAAALGWAVARAGLRPVDRLTAAVERVAVTGDLNSRIDVTGQHEIARLAGAFNGTLGALASSRAAQRLLVEDAGHELRTPLTSLRTNIELLIRAEGPAAEGRSLSAEDRSRLMGDLETQLTELTALTNELVDLAREDLSPEPVEPVDLAELVDATVQRARTRAPAVRFDTDLAPVAVPGRPASLERMVLNLLDNAAKWSPPGAPVRVALRAVDGRAEAELTVTDAGPGIAEHDLPRIFERFYRAVSARSMPGSGLGLAIVAQAVNLHGGRVEVDRPAGGGARFTVRLPAIPAES
jgi:two-component system sensor histidine kinase MprB